MSTEFEDYFTTQQYAATWIFELIILLFPEENYLFAVIWLKINISSLFFLLTETSLKLLETNKEMKKKFPASSTGYIGGFS